MFTDKVMLMAERGPGQISLVLYPVLMSSLTFQYERFKLEVIFGSV